jgi:hypothetical protein
MVQTWILIITLIGATTQSGQSIAVIPGFITVQECRDAAAQWRSNVYNAAAGDSRPTAAVCILQSKR